MFMPTMIRKDELVFGQTDAEFVDAQTSIDDFDPNNVAETRSVRTWIAPHTADALAMIARAHGVSPTIILGVMIENAVRRWPGRFDKVEEWDEDGSDAPDLLDRMMFGKEEKR